MELNTVETGGGKCEKEGHVKLENEWTQQKSFRSEDLNLVQVGTFSCIVLFRVTVEPFS